MDMRTKCMQFMYKWVTEGKIPNIRKNQVEELEAFVLQELSAAEIRRSAAIMDSQRIANQGPPKTNEEPSDA